MAMLTSSMASSAPALANLSRNHSHLNAGIVTATNDSNDMYDTLMQTSEGAMLLGDMKAAEGQNLRTENAPDDKFLRWEAERLLLTQVEGGGEWVNL